MLERTVAPLVGSFPENINIQQAESHQLTNGIPFFVLRAGTQAVVKVEVIFPYGGNAFESKPGQSFFANRLISSGTSDKTGAVITELLAEYGTAIQINPSFDNTSVSFLCLEKHITKVLPLFIAVISESVYPESELKREKDLQIANLRVQDNKTSVKASKYFRNALFSNKHAYGYILDQEDIDAITSQDLREFHQHNLMTAEVLVTGSFTDSTLNFIKTQFSSNYDIKHLPKRDVNIPPTATATRVKYPMADSVQCSLRIGKRIVGKSHEDYIVNLITTHVLGGYFGSRLMKNIREDKGLTYGIYSSIVNLKAASYFVIATDVKQQLVGVAIEEIHKELSVLGSSLISTAELNAVKNHMIGTYQSELNSAFALGSKFKSIHLFGLGYDYLSRYLNTIRQITPEQILNSAQSYLDVDTMTEVIVGGSE